jgi:hypothetical protein
MMKQTIFLISFLCVFVMLSPIQSAGQVIEQDADRILRQMSDYLNTLEQLSLHVENTTDIVLLSGHKMQVGSAVDVSVSRPDRFKADVKGDIRSQQIFYDGKTIILYGRRVGYYAIMEAPANIEAALDSARIDHGLIAPGADLIYRNSYDVLKENVNTGNYLGLHNVHGVECHHLIFTQDNVDWQIWIENSKTPVPRKLIVSEKWVTGGPQFTALFSDWNSSPKLKDSIFTFKPPKEAKKIKFRPVE